MWTNKKLHFRSRRNPDELALPAVRLLRSDQIVTSELVVSCHKRARDKLDLEKREQDDQKKKINGDATEEQKRKSST